MPEDDLQTPQSVQEAPVTQSAQNQEGDKKTWDDEQWSRAINAAPADQKDAMREERTKIRSEQRFDRNVRPYAPQRERNSGMNPFWEAAATATHPGFAGAALENAWFREPIGRRFDNLQFAARERTQGLRDAAQKARALIAR